jgi:hypothetical protein
VARTATKFAVKNHKANTCGPVRSPSRALRLIEALPCSCNRAVFILFLVAEVHPFADGNGRVARLMMNAEMVAGQRKPHIVPTIYRNIIWWP